MIPRATLCLAVRLTWRPCERRCAKIIETDMSSFTKTEAGRDLALNMRSLKRIGKSDDVADVTAFLASDGARWITGQVFP